VSVPYQRPQDPGLEGKILNSRYKVLETLGKGSFGATYVALDTHLFNRRRALKQLKPAKLDSFNVSTARRLFEREAQTLDKLGSHNQIPTLYAYFEENNDFYLVLELIEGKTLDKEEIKLGHKLSEAKVIDLLEGVLEPLAFLHANQVIHRDIKPSNLIRRQSDGKIVLIDFGAVKDISQNPILKGSSTVSIGSTGYRPLEQAQGRPQLASDIYAVGMLGIQALTGEEPWMLPEKGGQVLWQDQVEVSAELGSYLEKMVRSNYQDRFQTAAEALEALQSLKGLGSRRPEESSVNKDGDGSQLAASNPVTGQDPSTVVEERLEEYPQSLRLDGYMGHTVVDPILSSQKTLVTPPASVPDSQSLDGYTGHTIVDPIIPSQIHSRSPDQDSVDPRGIPSAPHLLSDEPFLITPIPDNPSHYHEINIHEINIHEPPEANTNELADKPLIDPPTESPRSLSPRRRFIYGTGSALLAGAGVIQYWRTSSPSSSRFKFESVRVDSQGTVVQRIRLEADYFLEDLGSGGVLPMVRIPAGEFTIGSPPTEAERDRDEERQQSLVLKTPFWIGQFPITQDQWRRVALWEKDKNTLDLNPDPANFKGSNRPVEQVSWYEAVEFCQRLSHQTGKTYRLPSEVEWEYACRAQTSTPFHFGETITTDIANFDGNSTYQSEPPGIYRGETTPVGSFQVANAFGLYDMHGNVREWCLNSGYESVSGHSMMSMTDSGSRVARGGAWLDSPGFCRSANRVFINADEKGIHVGFRVVCLG
jgi:formylglycine-generating enzyme required for sulfatase activity/serine/threonine protein kinase